MMRLGILLWLLNPLMQKVLKEVKLHIIRGTLIKFEISKNSLVMGVVRHIGAVIELLPSLGLLGIHQWRFVEGNVGSSRL